jgi:co-chaperonin GroES (HSP10)
MSYDPKKIRPRDGWLVVLAEPRRERLASGLFLPGAETKTEKLMEGAGRVITVGRGGICQRHGLEPGVRVLYRGFLKWANPIETEEKWDDGQVKQYFVMSAEDILAIIPDEMEIGIYGGRPQVPERS